MFELAKKRVVESLNSVTSAINDSYLSFTKKDEPIRRPFLVALSGVPGAGKSTMAKEIKERFTNWPKAQILSMDGYHIPLDELSDEKVYRRGAVDTFDLERFRSDMLRLKQTTLPKQNVKIWFPDFDHAKGDPEENKLSVVLGEDGVQIVIVEGLYVLCPEVNDIFDMSIFIESDIDKCISGLKERNKVIPGYTPEQIEKRCDDVDRKNANFVQTLKKYADFIVKGFNS